MTSEPQITLRALADSIAEQVRSATSTVMDLNNGIFGPRPMDDSGEKDPRSDLRSSLERSLDRLKELNGDLCRINNGVGITANSIQSKQSEWASENRPMTQGLR